MDTKLLLNDKDSNLQQRLVAEYKPHFDGLTLSQSKLLAMRMISELRQKHDMLSEHSKKMKDENISSEECSEYANLWNKKIYHIKAIIEASNCNLNSLIAYMIYDNDNQKYRDLYQESLISYNRILKNYHKLAQELKLSSALEISHLYAYMLWNGYYSFNKEHNYKLQSKLLLPSMNSFDVIKGQGVCLAYAELLHDYLTVCNHQSAILNCKCPTSKKDIICNYRPEITRNQQSSIWGNFSSKALNILVKGLINRMGNHTVTLINDDNKLFIYDPTNLYILNILNSEQASIINGQGIFEMKPHSSLLIDSNCDPYHLFEKVLSNETQSAFTRKEIIFSFENTLDLIKNNIDLLDEAYDNIQPDLAFINQQTDEFGGTISARKKIKQLKR